MAQWAMERHVNTAAIAASSATYVAAASYAAPPVADPLAPVGKGEDSKAAAAAPTPPTAASKNPNVSFPSPVAKKYPVTAYNVTAPAPVTNREFARALGRALHRPAVLPLPAFMLKLVYLAAPLCRLSRDARSWVTSPNMLLAGSESFRRQL
jgi:hypothetical protein